MMKTALLWMFVALLAVPATGWAQSLAGAAQAAEEQRQSVGEAREGRSFSNDNLTTEAPPAVPPRIAPNPALTASAADGEDGEAAEGDDAEADGEEEAVDTTSEEYWRTRIADARASLTESQTELAALQTRVNALTADFTAIDDPIQRQEVFNERQVALADLDAMQDTIAATQAQIAAIQEEARRAGVPAGWVR